MLHTPEQATTTPAFQSISHLKTSPRAATPNTYSPTDDRFAKLIGEDAWHRLPHSVRRRFAKNLSNGRSAVYVGQVVKTRINWAGWLLARLTAVLGSPLPWDDRATGPAFVIVTQNPRTQAQNWIRTYSRPHGNMHTIASEKRFCGPTGLEEYVGRGIGMTLTIAAKSHGLVFTSHRYFIDVGQMRLNLPEAFTPGRMTIVHRDLGRGRFAFELTLKHKIFGCLLDQRAEFVDSP